MLQVGADAHGFALFCSVRLLCDVCLVRMLASSHNSLAETRTIEEQQKEQN